jgi:hypothetical protein
MQGRRICLLAALARSDQALLRIGGRNACATVFAPGQEPPRSGGQNDGLRLASGVLDPATFVEEIHDVPILLKTFAGRVWRSCVKLRVDDPFLTKVSSIEEPAW